MTLAVTGCQPALIDNNGGVRIRLQGHFVPGRRYQVFVGTDAQGAGCYSGISGQGAVCIATASELVACLPAVAAGDVPFYVVDLDTSDSTTASGIARAEAPFLCSYVYSLRQNVRPILAVGETSPAQLPDASPVPGFV